MLFSCMMVCNNVGRGHDPADAPIKLRGIVRTGNATFCVVFYRAEFVTWSAGRCVAQRIELYMIASGNHTAIYMPPPYDGVWNSNTEQ